MHEFIDGEYQAAEFLADIGELSPTKKNISHQIPKLQQLLQEDPDYYDTYLILADFYEKLGNRKEADNLYEMAFQKAKFRVMASTGQWPDRLQWEYVENRHILRAFANQAERWWAQDQIDEALSLLKQMLLMDPVDNIGARFRILAIRLNISQPEYGRMFCVNGKKEFLSSEIFNWFDRHFMRFPGDFEEWDRFVKKELLNGDEMKKK